MAVAARVFISYAHADDALRKKLRSHLSALEHDGLVAAWDDHAIPAGEEWADEIDQRLEQADVILLLISADFIHSKYCYGKEMKKALELHAAKDAVVIPVILRKCDWKTLPFAKLQALPRDGLPLSEWKTEDDYFTAVATGLRELIDPNGKRPVPVPLPARPPWWQRPAVLASLAAALVVSGLAAWAWFTASARVKGEVAEGVATMRTGRYEDARAILEPLCRRWLVREGACLALEKAWLGAALEAGLEAAELEQFTARVHQLLDGAPDDPDLLLFSGELAFMERDPETKTQKIQDGVERIQHAIRLVPALPEAHFALANLQLMAANYPQALALLDEAVSLAPGAPHYLNARAYARARMGDIAGARADYERSAEDGGLILSRIELAELLWQSPDFQAADDQLQAALGQLGDDGTPLAGRNRLPWTFELAPGRNVTLKLAGEKRCLARLMSAASQALIGGMATLEMEECGANTTSIAVAVAATLDRAVAGGMRDVEAQRARVFSAGLKRDGTSRQ